MQRSFEIHICLKQLDSRTELHEKTESAAPYSKSTHEDQEGGVSKKPKKTSVPDFRHAASFIPICDYILRSSMGFRVTSIP